MRLLVSADSFLTRHGIVALLGYRADAASAGAGAAAALFIVEIQHLSLHLLIRNFDLVWLARELATASC